MKNIKWVCRHCGRQFYGTEKFPIGSDWICLYCGQEFYGTEKYMVSWGFLFGATIIVTITFGALLYLIAIGV